MSDVENFATWLVDNQDKKGTPEFDTVATAFKALDTPTSPVFNPITLLGGSMPSIAPPAPRDSSLPLPDASDRSLFRETADVGLQFGKGAVSGVRFITDTLGAGNPLSQALSGTEEWLDSLLSAQSKRDQQEVARILKEAEDKGMGAQVVAGLKALTVAPVDLVVNAFGTSVPVLVAGLLGGMAGLGARGVATGVGVLTGVGITKGAINDAVFQELISAGVSEADAKEAAKEAQAYGGNNLDNIAFGGFLGGIASKVGMEPKILTSGVGRRLAGDVSAEGLKNATKLGLIKEASRTALKEALPEALQGGQEQFASNIALQREGIDTPTFRGVTGAATLEGAVGAPVGAISSLGSDIIKPRGTELADIEAEIERLAGEQETETFEEKEEEAAQEDKVRLKADRQKRMEEADRAYWRKRKESEKSYAERGIEERQLEGVAAYENPEEIRQRVVDEVYEKLINEGVLEDEAVETAELRGEEAADAAIKREFELQGVEETVVSDAADELTRREQEDLQAFIDTEAGYDGYVDSVKNKMEKESGVSQQRQIDDYLKSLSEGRLDKLFKFTPDRTFRKLVDNAVVEQNKAYNNYRDRVERAIQNDLILKNLIQAGYKKTDLGRFLRALRDGKTNSIFPKFKMPTTQETTKGILKYIDINKARGLRKTKEVDAFFSTIDLERPISDVIKSYRTTKGYAAAALKEQARTKKEFPNIEKEDLLAIEEAKLELDIITEKIFSLRPDSTIDPSKSAEDPIAYTEYLADAETVEEYWLGLKNAQNIPGFTAEDDLLVDDVNAESGKLKGEASNLKGEKRKRALAINKYFNMPFVDTYPELALEELAIDVALDPTGIEQEIIDSRPVSVRSSTGRLPTPPKEVLTKALELIPTDARRTALKRSVDTIKATQNAKDWVLESELSTAIKDNFIARVDIIREDHKKQILKNARSLQGADNLRKNKIAEELGVESASTYVSDVFKFEEGSDNETKAFNKAKRQIAKDVKNKKVPDTFKDVKEEVSALEGEDVDTDADASVDAANRELTKQQATAKLKKINREAKKIQDKLQEKQREKINTAAHGFATKEMTEKYKGKPLKKDEPNNRTEEWNTLYIAEKSRLLKAYDAALKAKATDKELTPEQKTQLEKDLPKDVEAFRNTKRQEIAEELNLSIDDPAVETELNKRITVEGTPNILPGVPKYTADASDKKRLAQIIDPQKPQEIDPIIQEYANNVRGLNRTIEILLASEPKEIRPVLRKLRKLAAGTKVRIESFADPEEVGRYYSEERVIALDPERGMNKATFFHELSHAGLDRLLANPDSKEVKKLFEFYSSIKTQMGDAYGGTDLYEFVAELVGNSEFQNLLKTIKAPKSKSLWDTIIDSILEFLNIRKGQSAYDASFKFLNDVIEARPSIEPSRLERMFFANENPEVVFKEASDELPPFRSRRLKETMENIEGPANFVDKLKTGASGALRLDNLMEAYGKHLPGIKQIIEFVEKRQGEQEQGIAEINKKYKQFYKLADKYNPAMKTMGKMAIAMRLARVDIFEPAPSLKDKTGKNKTGKELVREEKRLKAYKEGKATFEKLGKMEGGKSIQNMYKIMRADFDKTYKDYVNVLLNSIKDFELRNEVKKQFDAEKPIAGYIPARRYGDFVLIYVDKATGERTVRTFESRSKRNKEIKALGLNHRIEIQKQLNEAETEEERKSLKEQTKKLKVNDYVTLNSIKSTVSASFPPENFIADAMEAVKQTGEEQGLGKEQAQALATSVYEAYVDLFPDTSLMQQFQTSADIAGASDDILRVWGESMVKWERKLADLKYNAKIQEGFNKVRSQASGYSQLSPSDPSESTIHSLGRNIAGKKEGEGREEFTLNPQYAPWAAGATTGSYFLFMAGNVSSGVVNLSSVPLLAYPILAARYGGIKTATALGKASKTAINDWETDPKYKVLYETLRDHAQLRHTLEREVLEGARQSSEEYTTLTAKALSFLSIPISETEKLNRATTGITAFELAKADGKSDKEAAEIALKTVKDVNTSGMATTAPKWLQSDIGRVMWTFKGFIWQSTWVTAKAFVDATAGQDRATKIQATKQLFYMYGMSYAVGGMFGLPLFGALSTLITMVGRAIDLYDDDEDAPFHFRTALRQAGFSEMLLKGPINAQFNLEISGRASIANGIAFREEPYEIEKFGYLNAMALQMVGPMGSYLLDSTENLALIADGEIKRGSERLLPSWLRNGLKTSRFLQEGARTRDGRPISTDISGWNLYMQALGFTPADVSFLYEARSLSKSYENKVMDLRADVLKDRYIAVTTGDKDLNERSLKRLNGFRRSYPYLISNQTLNRSYKSRKASELEYISGIRFNNSFRKEILPFFRNLENTEYYGNLN